MRTELQPAIPFTLTTHVKCNLCDWELVVPTGQGEASKAALEGSEHLRKAHPGVLQAWAEEWMPNG
jgi:hypothetical protein